MYKSVERSGDSQYRGKMAFIAMVDMSDNNRSDDGASKSKLSGINLPKGMVLHFALRNHGGRPLDHPRYEVDEGEVDAAIVDILVDNQRRLWVEVVPVQVDCERHQDWTR